MKKLLFVLGLLFLLPVAANAQATFANIKGIKVYIPQKNLLSTTMQHAFMDWQKHTNNKFSFDYVGTKTTAKIEVIFVETGINTICKSPRSLGCTSLSSVKTSNGTGRILGAKVYISMRDNDNKPMTKNEVYTIMLHEVGHALGLSHSQDSKSLMYSSTNSEMAEVQEIQPEDVKNLYKLYGIN